MDDRELDRLRAAAADAERQVMTLEARLAEAETRLARTGELELELRELGVAHAEALGALERARADAAAQAERADRAERVQREMADSVSWKVTAPLRRIRR